MSIIFKTLRVGLLLGAFCLANVQAYGQVPLQKSFVDCVELRMTEQKTIPILQEAPALDVIVDKPDDIHFRFNLKNNCSYIVYFLASSTPDVLYPAGYLLYRDKGGQWKSKLAGWRREGDLTGVVYTWVPLEPTKQVEFEYSDLSKIEKERSIAIYLNTAPTHDRRVEFLATPFRPRH
jgi:hypothetical protein